jgi:membrane protease YdiL (CAAX protease family)
MNAIAIIVWVAFVGMVLVAVVARIRGRVVLGFGVRQPGVVAESTGGFLIVAAAMVALFGALVAAGGTSVVDVSLRPAVWWHGSTAFLSWAVLEEVLSRMGLLIGLLVVTRRPWVALGVSSVSFGAVHLLDDDATVLGAVSSALGGVMYGLALLRTARLWMPIAMHFAWNFVQGTVLGFPVSGEHRLGVPFLPEHQVVGGLLDVQDHGPSALTGGDYGPEGGLPSLGARLLIVAGVLIVTRRVHRGRTLLRIPAHSTVERGDEVPASGPAG